MKKVWSMLVVAVMLVGMFGGMVEAYKQSDVDKLLKTNVCPNGDLSHADLAGADLAGADL